MWKTSRFQIPSPRWVHDRGLRWLRIALRRSPGRCWLPVANCSQQSSAGWLELAVTKYICSRFWGIAMKIRIANWKATHTTTATPNETTPRNCLWNQPSFIVHTSGDCKLDNIAGGCLLTVDTQTVMFKDCTPPPPPSRLYMHLHIQVHPNVNSIVISHWWENKRMIVVCWGSCKGTGGEQKNLTNKQKHSQEISSEWCSLPWMFDKQSASWVCLDKQEFTSSLWIDYWLDQLCQVAIVRFIHRHPMHAYL